MNVLKKAMIALSLTALPLSISPKAEACGGCFHEPLDVTQVTGHRMIVSTSPTQTTLWDQISYAGDPKSFAWVLPIKGMVNVELSSDALFEALDQATSARVQGPSPACPFGPPSCNTGSASASSGSAGGGGVTVIAEEVVGPFITVQLAANDPIALQDWFTQNNYNIPLDVKPVIDAYLAEGFGFLAMKLAPGQGVDSMRPVRVSWPGANPTIPLRMVAAGTGAVTPIELWIFGEGRYEPTNFSFFTIQDSEIVWNWDTSSSNYSELLQAKIDQSGGKSWNMESSTPFSIFDLQFLCNLAQLNPKDSGYEDPMGPPAVDACNADLATITAGINENALWVTKIYAQLPRAALATDLSFGASAEQKEIPRTLIATKTIGTDDSCGSGPINCGDTSSGTGGHAFEPDGGGGCACAIENPESPIETLVLIALGSSAALLRRRKRGHRAI